MSGSFLKIASPTQKTKALFSRSCCLDNKQVRQFVKFLILSTSCTHTDALSTPDTKAVVIRYSVLVQFCLISLRCYKCDALRDLVSFVQIKKREKHPWRNVTFSKVAC